MSAVDEIPEVMYLTKHRSEWSYHIYESLVHALARVEQEPEYIQCWKVEVTPMTEMTYVPPTSASLR